MKKYKIELNRLKEERKAAAAAKRAAEQAAFNALKTRVHIDRANELSAQNLTYKRGTRKIDAFSGSQESSVIYKEVVETRDRVRNLDRTHAKMRTERGRKFAELQFINAAERTRAREANKALNEARYAKRRKKDVLGRVIDVRAGK